MKIVVTAGMWLGVVTRVGVIDSSDERSNGETNDVLMKAT